MASRVRNSKPDVCERSLHGKSARQRYAPGARLANEVPPIVHEVLRSPGAALDADARAYFQPRFGFDFGRIRIHTDARAASSARAIDALAYTAGPHIVFGAGQYVPGTSVGRTLLAHELTHAVQQSMDASAPPDRLSLAPSGGALEREADRVSAAVVSGQSLRTVSRGARPVMVARKPDGTAPATAADRRQVVEAAARWLTGMADQVAMLRRLAAAAHATTPGRAAAPRAFHRYLNQERLGRLMANAISVFEAQRSQNPYVSFPAESPEQTRLGEAYARAIEQFGLAIEEARINAANLAPTAREAEEGRFAQNHLRWLAANPSAPMAAGVRTTFTPAEVALSARRHRQTTQQLSNLAATVHRYDLAGDGAQRLRGALQDALYRLMQDPASGRVTPERDSALEATIRPILRQLSGIEWAIGEAVARLQRAEARTRAFAADPTASANAAAGAALQRHFSTGDAGYATLLADRFARMVRELRGEGALAIHARDPQDSSCGIGSVGAGLSTTVAHAEANRFRFCQDVSVGDQRTVSTVIHETVHAVIPSLGARGPVTSATRTPADRAYEFERIYSRLTTEEALDNAESYAFYVDDLLGIQVRRQAAPQDVVRGCSNPDTVHDAIARATYRIRIAAMWAGQTADRFRGTDLPAYIVSIVQLGFPGADAARVIGVLTHLRYLASRLEYYLPVTCCRASDREARAGALVYGPRHAAAVGTVTSTRRGYPSGTLRICPAWFQASASVREDTLTAILVLRYRSSVPAGDVTGLVALARHIQEEVHPSLATRTLQQHQAADVPTATRP